MYISRPRSVGGARAGLLVGVLARCATSSLTRALDAASDSITGMSHAYLVGQVTVKSPEHWAEYTRQVPATLVPWGAELVFRGKQFAAFSGQSPHADIVVIRFPDAAAVNDWFASAEYQALIPLREEAAEVVLLAYQA